MPWPPDRASIRRPVSMLVWLGSVRVCSRTVRAFSVTAPSRIRWKFGAPDAPSVRIALGFKPSTEMATTRLTGSSAELVAAAAVGALTAGPRGGSATCAVAGRGAAPA